MSGCRLHILNVSALLLLLGVAVPAHSEGTRELGLTTGLSRATVVNVRVDQVGELIVMCSSDDGIQSDPIDGVPLDTAPGEESNKDPLRDGADIVAYPPTDRPCEATADCGLRQICFDRALEIPYAFAPDSQGTGICGYVFRINPTSNPGLGVCNADTIDPLSLQLSANEIGVWRLDFVGEQSTTGAPERNTRFFDIEVRDPTGQETRNQRVFSYQWYLTSHNAVQLGRHEFYVRRQIDGVDYWVATTLDEAAQFSYGLLAHVDGISENQGRGSACERVNDERSSPPCLLSFEGRRAALAAQLPLYLNGANAQAFPPINLSDVSFQDDQGTPSISPNGDGIQDIFNITFNSTLPGRVRLWLDLDDDLSIDYPNEIVLSQTFATGDQRLTWDGLDLDGETIPDGTYSFSFHFSFGELHLISVGLEALSGFLTFSEAELGPRPANWNDTSILTTISESAFQSPWHRERRSRIWREEAYPDEQRPVLFDTWTNLAEAFIDEATCIRCDGPFATVRIGGIDEPADNDLDGLTNEEEDSNGNGMIDPGETDPNDSDTDDDGLDDRTETLGEPSPVRPDTDQDGLNDGIEDESGDGFFQEGETDSTDPDTDGDRLYDGEEDANQNGRVDPGETDPRLADTDGDGLNDADDPFPLDPERPTMEGDGFTPLANDSPDAFGLDGDAGRDLVNNENYEESNFFGCDCSMTSRTRPFSRYFWLLVAIIGLRPRRAQ